MMLVGKAQKEKKKFIDSLIIKLNDFVMSNLGGNCLVVIRFVYGNEGLILLHGQ